MAETFVLNPTPTHPLNFDYGFVRKRPITHLTQKPLIGAPFYRELTDVGHSMQLNWIDRPASTARALKHAYEQYRDGYFTLIDHEDQGRHYVGRFSSPVEPVPTAHGKWTVQYVSFDEVPGAPMLKYPNRWDQDAIWRNLVSDFGELRLATTVGAWALAANVAAQSGYLMTSGGVVGDTALMAYEGYGFQFWSPTGPDRGQANVYVDGNFIQLVDFYTAAPGNSKMLMQKLDLPLGLHVVKLSGTGLKNGASTGYGIQWDALKVMR